MPFMEVDEVLGSLGVDDDIPDFLDELDRLHVEVPEPGGFETKDAWLIHADGHDSNVHSRFDGQAGPVCAQEVLEQRMSRTRARNRAAQARYRQKRKAEYDARAAQLAEAHRRVSDAHRRLELLRATHTALSKRAAAAVCAKVAVLRGEDPTVESARVSPPRPDDHAPAKRARDSLPVATRLLLARNWKRGSAARPPLPGHLYTSASTDPGYAVLARRGETQRPDSWHLFTPPTLVPPSLASFCHHAAVSYCDLVKASGSQTGVIDFGAATAWELMNGCMAATLRQLGCDARDVCWFAQMEFEAAPGLPLSYSCTLSTPECVASCVMFLQALNFEAALISAALQLPGFRGESYSNVSTTGDSGGLAGRPASPKRHRPVIQPAPVPTEQRAEGVGNCTTAAESPRGQPGGAGTGGPSTGSSTARPPDACRCGAAVPGTCVRLRCGVNLTCCASASVRLLVAGLHTRYRSIVPGVMLRKVFSAIMSSTGAMLEATPPPPDPADASAGKVPDAAVEAYGGFLASVSQSVFVVLQMFVTAIREVLDADTMAGPPVDTIKPCRHSDVPADGRPEAAVDADEGADSPLAAGGGAAAALEARIYSTLVSMCMGYQLVQRNAPRVIWTLISGSVFPRDSFLEVENFHVYIYKLLNLTDQQKDLYAANWSLWEQRRKANDDPAAQLASLRAVPAALDLPLPFMRHVADAAAGVLHDDDLDFDRSKLMRHERKALDAGPALLGAVAGAAVAAGAAMRALWTAHDGDALMVTETIDLQIQPGALLEPPQIAQAFGIHLLHGTTPIDFMAICRLAAAERRREEVRRLPSIVAAPDGLLRGEPDGAPAGGAVAPLPIGSHGDSSLHPSCGC